MTVSTLCFDWVSPFYLPALLFLRHILLKISMKITDMCNADLC